MSPCTNHAREHEAARTVFAGRFVFKDMKGYLKLKR
jgi:hypothetical protein